MSFIRTCRTGKADEACEILQQLMSRSHEQYVTPYMLARIYSALGDVDQAFRWLNISYPPPESLQTSRGAASLGARKSGVRIFPGRQVHQKVVPRWRNRTAPDGELTRVGALRGYAHEPWNAGCRICLLLQPIVIEPEKRSSVNPWSAQQCADQLRLAPRHIDMAVVKIGAIRIPRKRLRKEGDDFAIDDSLGISVGCQRAHVLHEQCGQIVLSSEPQVTQPGTPGVQLDQLGAVASLFEDEIKTMEAGQSECGAQHLASTGHFRMLDETHDRARGSRSRLLGAQHLNVHRTEQLATPARQHRVRLPARNITLQ